MAQQNRSRGSARIAVIAFVALAVAGGVYVACFRGKTPPPAAAATATAPAAAAAKPATPDLSATVVPPKPEPKAEVKPEVKHDASPAPKDDLAKFRQLYAAGKWYEARGALAAIFQTTSDDAVRTELAAKGMELNQKLL